MSEFTKGPWPYDSQEARDFKRRAIHLHVHDGGHIEAWGDGHNVLMIRHPSRRDQIGETVLLVRGGKNLFGEPFRYSDHFTTLAEARAALAKAGV